MDQAALVWYWLGQGCKHETSHRVYQHADYDPKEHCIANERPLWRRRRLCPCESLHALSIQCTLASATAHLDTENSQTAFITLTAGHQSAHAANSDCIDKVFDVTLSKFTIAPVDLVQESLHRVLDFALSHHVVTATHKAADGTGSLPLPTTTSAAAAAVSAAATSLGSTTA